MDRDELLRALRAFEDQSLEYVLIGATTMGFHGLIRATEDIDLLIRPTPENIERGSGGHFRWHIPATRTSRTSALRICWEIIPLCDTTP